MPLVFGQLVAVEPGAVAADVLHPGLPAMESKVAMRAGHAAALGGVEVVGIDAQVRARVRLFLVKFAAHGNLGSPKDGSLLIVQRPQPVQAQPGPGPKRPMAGVNLDQRRFHFPRRDRPMLARLPDLIRIEQDRAPLLSARLAAPSEHLPEPAGAEVKHIAMDVDLPGGLAFGHLHHVAGLPAPKRIRGGIENFHAEFQRHVSRH